LEVVNDFGLTYDQMLIVEKYERVMNYLYPIFQSIPNKHNVLRTIVIEHLHKFPGLIYSAAKSTQQSKLYQADTSLSELRMFLRRIVFIKHMSLHQQDTAMVLIAIVGKLLGSWIKRTLQKG
jgi:hypothetical protein